MALTKEQVQKRVLKNGEPLSLDLFSWDEKTRTFSSYENGLVLDFKGLNNINFITGSNCTFNTGNSCTFDTGACCTFTSGSNCGFNTGSDCVFKTGNSCTFDTGYACTFNTGSLCDFKTSSVCNFKTGSICNFNTGFKCTFTTGSDCVFKTGYNCNFNTGYNCNFNTGSDCTFNTGSKCVIIRRDKFEIIEPKENETIKLCPYNIPGYLKQKGDKWVYSEDENEENEYIIIDNILSRVLLKRKGIYKVINYGEEKQTYIVKDGDIYSHGESISEAVESIRYKIGKRDKTEYENMSIETELNKIEAIRMYRVITGACEAGTKYFVEQYEKQNDKKEVYRIKEIIEMTKGQYGNDKLIQFFK